MFTQTPLPPASSSLGGGSIAHLAHHQELENRTVILGALGDTGAWTNVLTYGAVGDGVTDDTAAIQDALDAATNTGVLILPPLTYRLELPATSSHGALTIPSGVTIIGYGATFVVDTASETNYRIILGIGNTTTPSQDVTILGLTIDGELNADSAIEPCMGVGFYDAAARVRISGCTFRDINGDGINSDEAASGDNVVDVTIDHNTFVGVSGQAVVMAGSGTADWVVSENICRDSRNDGAAETLFFIAGSFIASNNTLSGWGNILASGADGLIEGNRVTPQEGGQTCIGVTADRVVVRGNLCDASDTTTAAGVLIAAAVDGCVVEGNKIIRGSGDVGGILASTDGNTNLIVSGNHIDGGTDDGDHQPDVLLYGSTAGLTFTDNMLVSPGTAAAFLREVTYGTITGNNCRYGATIINGITESTISANHFRGANAKAYNISASDAGLYTFNAIGCAIVGNRVSVHAANHGIRIEGTIANRNLVANNVIYADTLNHIQETNAGADYNVFAHNMLLSTGTGVLVSGAHSYAIPLAPP